LADKVLQANHQERYPEDDEDFDRIPDMQPAEYPDQHKASTDSDRNARQDRDRDFQHRRRAESLASIDAHEGREKHDVVNIICRCTGHDQLRDAVFPAIAGLDQMDHFGHDHSRRNRPEDGTQDRCLQITDAKQQRCQQDHSDDLESRRDKAHQERRPAHFLEIPEVQR